MYEVHKWKRKKAVYNDFIVIVVCAREEMYVFHFDLQLFLSLSISISIHPIQSLSRSLSNTYIVIHRYYVDILHLPFDQHVNYMGREVEKISLGRQRV